MIDSGHFIVSVNDREEFGNNRESEFKVKSGQQMKLSIEPSQLVATEKFSLFPQLERGCRFKHDVNPNSIFKASH